VTSTDYVAALLERGQDRARAEHLEVIFQVADAEALPFADESYDAVLSTFGVMFAPDQATARNWRGSAEGAGGSVWRTGRRKVSSARCSGLRSPRAARRGPAAVELGHRSVVAQPLQRARISAAGHPPHFNFRYRSAAHFIDIFRHWYGPVHKASRHCRRKAVRRWRVIWRTAQPLESGGSRSLVVPSEYLEVVITKR
jgi:SAM-dependent methyltransferase